jgi:hypothetical protein
MMMMMMMTTGAEPSATACFIFITSATAIAYARLSGLLPFFCLSDLFILPVGFGPAGSGF